VLGVLIEIWAIWHLKFAFATEPAARRFVTSGPYRFMRHPIYSGSCLTFVGLLMTRQTIPVVVAVVVWSICARLRMGYEEAILMSVFPSYAEYRRRVGAIVPRLRSIHASSAHSITTSISTGI
jgi:protein-S-isoprenylcysteine O-methyltransferase Ste14